MIWALEQQLTCHVNGFDVWCCTGCLAALWSAGVHGLELLPDPKRGWGILTARWFRFTWWLSRDSNIAVTWMPEFHNVSHSTSPSIHVLRYLRVFTASCGVVGQLDAALGLFCWCLRSCCSNSSWAWSLGRVRWGFLPCWMHLTHSIKIKSKCDL